MDIKKNFYIMKQTFKYFILPHIKSYNPFDFKTYVFITNDLERVYSTPKSRFKHLVNKVYEIKNIMFLD